jgi:flavodoxin
VEKKKNALIVTDGIESTQKVAASISAELEGYQVLTVAASDFAGADILPADIIFLGSEKPDPASFVYIQELLKHINLASRNFGVFSAESQKTLKYLTGLVKDSEALLAEPFLAKDKNADAIKKWVKSVLKS